MGRSVKLLMAFLFLFISNARSENPPYSSNSWLGLNYGFKVNKKTGLSISLNHRTNLLNTSSNKTFLQTVISRKLNKRFSVSAAYRFGYKNTIEQTSNIFHRYSVSVLYSKKIIKKTKLFLRFRYQHGMNDLYKELQKKHNYTVRGRALVRTKIKPFFAYFGYEYLYPISLKYSLPTNRFTVDFKSKKILSNKLKFGYLLEFKDHNFDHVIRVRYSL